MSEVKKERAEWLTRVYSSDAQAISDDVANGHLFDRLNDFGLDHFLATFRPLTKLRETRGELQFELGKLTHDAADLSFAEFLLDGQVCFEVRIRFEPEPPHRIHYWGSYPPLPDGVKCVAINQRTLRVAWHWNVFVLWSWQTVASGLLIAVILSTIT